MRKLILCPTIESYSASPKSGVVSTEVDAGYSRVRQGHLRSPTIVEVSWKLYTFADVEYLQAFYRVGINGGVDKFLLNLQGLDQQDSATGLHEYVCLIVPNSFTSSENTGKFQFSYSASLEVESVRADESADSTKLDQAETLGNTSPFA